MDVQQVITKVSLSKCPLCESGIAGLPNHESVDGDGTLVFSTTFRCGNVTRYTEDDTTLKHTPTDLCRKARNVNLDTYNLDLQLQLKQRMTCPKCKASRKSDKYVCEKCADELGAENKALCLALVNLAVRYVADGYAPLPPGRVLATAPGVIEDTKKVLREAYTKEPQILPKDQLKILEEMVEEKWHKLR